MSSKFTNSQPTIEVKVNSPTANLGITGPRGPVGPQGEPGPKGERGATGPVGPQGLQGEQGIQGLPGEKGEQGEPGARGEKGEKGDKGADGAQGPKGEKGDIGPQGPQGPKGEPGKDGENGKDTVYLGNNEPSAEYNIWLNPDGEADSLATKAELNAVENKIPAEYVKSAAVANNKLTLTKQDNTIVEFEGGSGGGSSYTFTNGLTETNGTVSWDLNDRIKSCSGNGSLILREEVSSAFNPTATDSIFHCYSGNISGSGHVILNGENMTVQGQNHIVSGQNITIQGGTYNFLLGSGTMSHNNMQFGFGSTINVKGSCGACFGEKTTQNGCYQIVSGINNIPDSGEGWNKGIYAVIVGNGTWSSQANAYTLDWQGNGTFAGTVSSSTGADYAEYFEWKDGNPNNEDRVGYIVTLDGDKIVKATSGDDVLGICSGTAMVLGDSAEWNWSKRYLTDDFGRIIYEDYDVEHEEVKDENTGKVIEEAWTEHIHAPKQNPDYDASQPYTKRADRPEWQIVGMMGKIYVRDDGSCVVNGYADVKDGIATKATGKTNMRVMARVNENIVRVLLK